MTQSLTALEQALVLAAPEGYVRIFLDEGAPMLALLRQAAVQGIMPGYVRTLLAGGGEVTPPRDPSRVDAGAWPERAADCPCTASSLTPYPPVVLTARSCRAIH
jgi:hypothetical protein